MMSFKRILPFMALAVALMFSSCEVNIQVSAPAPNPPTGLEAVNKDGQVRLSWQDLSNSDVDGYGIYRTTNLNTDFHWIGDVNAFITAFLDTGLSNGITYYYAVTAYNSDGIESDPSSYVFTTPRPEGDATVFDLFVSDTQCGFDFSSETVTDEWDGDFYLLFDGSGIPYLYPNEGVWIADSNGGSHISMDEVDQAMLYPGFYQKNEMELEKNHIYVFYMENGSNGNYAKLWVTDFDSDEFWVSFEWAYQVDPDNPDI